MNKRQIIHHLRLYKLNRFLHQPLLFKKELFYMRKHVLEGLYIMQNLQEFVSLDNAPGEPMPTVQFFLYLLSK